MALFGSKNKKEEKNDAPSKTILREMGETGSKNGAMFSRVIIRPRITEKATMKSEGGVYTFDVSSRATKGSVSSAVRALFKVTPIKVSIITTRGKKMFARGKRGNTPFGKKAYVYLKKGDKIEFV